MSSGDHETVELFETNARHSSQFDHYWRLTLAEQPAAVLVSRQAIGNKCYTSLLANFLDVFQLIVSLFWTSNLQRTHTLTLWCLPRVHARRRICKTELLTAVVFSELIVLWKIRCLHHGGGVWLHHVNAFVFGSIPSFAQACESSWKLGCVSSVCAWSVCVFFSSRTCGI